MCVRLDLGADQLRRDAKNAKRSDRSRHLIGKEGNQSLVRPRAPHGIVPKEIRDVPDPDVADMILDKPAPRASRLCRLGRDRGQYRRPSGDMGHTDRPLSACVRMAYQAAHPTTRPMMIIQTRIPQKTSSHLGQRYMCLIGLAVLLWQPSTCPHVERHSQKCMVRIP
jgi:hypothetical protein